MQKATVACSIYIFDNSPWTEMNDETPAPPNHPNLSLSMDVENIWKQKHSAVGSTVKTWSLKSWEHLRTNLCKYEKNTFNSDMWISLMRNLANNGNQPRNPHFHSPSTCSKKSPRSTMNDETPAPPNHPNLSLSQDAGKVWESDIMTLSATFSDSAEPIPHTRPLRPRRQCRSIPNRSLWRTRLSSAPRPRPGNRDRSRLASSSRALRFKSWSLKSREHMTFNSDIWISLIQNLANNTESDSCLPHLHIWQLSLNRDEWWNYRGPPNHPNLSLSKDVEHIWKQKHSAVGSTIKTWSLKSWEHLRTNLCKYETITFNSDMWISLMRNLANNGNQPRNPHFHSEIHHLHVPRSPLDQPWMTKLQHLQTIQTIQTCHCHRMPGKYGKVTSWHCPQHSAILRSPSHTPGLGALGANDVGIQTDARDGRVCLQRRGQGLETETDQGWRLHPGLYGSIRDHWNPEKTWHLTLTCESLWYRT